MFPCSNTPDSDERDTASLLLGLIINTFENWILWLAGKWKNSFSGLFWGVCIVRLRWNRERTSHVQIILNRFISLQIRKQKYQKYTWLLPLISTWLITHLYGERELKIQLKEDYYLCLFILLETQHHIIFLFQGTFWIPTLPALSGPGWLDGGNKDYSWRSLTKHF